MVIYFDKRLWKKEEKDSYYKREKLWEGLEIVVSELWMIQDTLEKVINVVTTKKRRKLENIKV